MTTKFTQARSRTKAPAVCHVFPWPPVPFIPQSNPNLTIFCHYKLRLPDSTYWQINFKTRLKWYYVQERWYAHTNGPGYGVDHNVVPELAFNRTQISTALFAIHGIGWITGWYAPQYTPKEPWESGEKTLTQPVMDYTLWQTLTTAQL